MFLPQSQSSFFHVLFRSDYSPNKIQFTVASESCYPEFRKQLVLSTVDGGSSTLK